MINKQPTIDDIYNFDAYISTPGVREGLMQRATLEDAEFTVEDTDAGQAMYFNAPHGEQLFVGMKDQTGAMGTMPGDIQLAEVGANRLPERAYTGYNPDTITGVEQSTFEKALENSGIGLEQAGRFLDSLGQVDVPLLGTISLADFVPFVGTVKGGSRSVLGDAEWQGTPMALQQAGTGVPLTRGTGFARQMTEDASLAAMDTAFNLVPTLKAGKLLIKGATKAGKALAPKAGEMAANIMERGGVPIRGLNIIEPGLNVMPGNKLGLEPDLRVKIVAPDLEMPDKPLLVLSTDAKNVNRQIENLDVIFQKFPDPTLTEDSWTKLLGYSFKSDEVPIPPYAAIKALESPENLAKPLRNLTQGQIDDASAGFKNAAQFKDLYTAGKADVVTTGKLFLWSFLSRGVSPYVQEGLFMDAIGGIEPFLKKAASGKFDATDLSEYLAWASTIAGKGSGQPGSGATHNLNAFGKNFLTKLAVPDENGLTGLQKVHEMMANPNMTGPQIRREFAKIGTGVGIDNKVVSFTLLVSGRDDVLVIDRVQLRNLWDDGQFSGKNLWDGRSEKRMVKKKDGTQVEESAQIAGTALSDITYGVKGLLVYETLERAMAQKLKEAYKLVGREGDASLGRYHWETWVAGSQQEASHGTIDAIMREAAGVEQPFKGVTAKQGEYGMYDYGAKYGVDEGGPYFIYDNSKGEQYRFTVPEFRDMLGLMKDTKTGIVPKNFRVSASGNSPWFTRPEVNRSKLDDLITARGTPVGNETAGKQPVSADGQSTAANGSGPGANGGGSTSVKRGRRALLKGAE
jgi:hypothetical protein